MIINAFKILLSICSSLTSETLHLGVERSFPQLNPTPNPLLLPVSLPWVAPHGCHGESSFWEGLCHSVKLSMCHPNKACYEILPPCAHILISGQTEILSSHYTCLTYMPRVMWTNPSDTRAPLRRDRVCQSTESPLQHGPCPQQTSGPVPSLLETD